MALILEELRKEYAAMFTTEFIDVWKNPVAGKQHGVEMISTQIFYDAQGKEDILNKWKELGIQFAAGEQQRSATLFRGQMLCGPLRLWQTVR
jgi:thioredoxin 1